jgi:hypothetical protein
MTAWTWIKWAAGQLGLLVLVLLSGVLGLAMLGGYLAGIADGALAVWQLVAGWFL